jgi:Predicted metal-dependent hydrolases related to alanyl-tRNA synthetase HxxxH domain
VTQRLYYHDSYLAEFTAKVTAVEGERVYLDRTAFYPTSGGQPHDLGELGGTKVVDVVDEQHRIAHVLSAPPALTPGTEVACRVDWARRFDLMQQHTGQHLLSAVFEELFGHKTVSVHFGDAYSTLDLDAESLSPTAWFAPNVAPTTSCWRTARSRWSSRMPRTRADCEKRWSAPAPSAP